MIPGAIRWQSPEDGPQPTGSLVGDTWLRGSTELILEPDGWHILHLLPSIVDENISFTGNKVVGEKVDIS